MGLMRVREVASILRVSQPTVRKLVKTNQIASIRIGGSIRIDAAELARYLKGIGPYSAVPLAE